MNKGYIIFAVLFSLLAAYSIYEMFLAFPSVWIVGFGSTALFCFAMISQIQTDSNVDKLKDRISELENE